MLEKLEWENCEKSMKNSRCLVQLVDV